MEIDDLKRAEADEKLFLLETLNRDERTHKFIMAFVELQSLIITFMTR